ncbi:GNAT family N-acetyltransferase [Bacillus sp. AFS076308]|uniref:GNAT family N-acetyltransferase n=1 Tax=unclassified Bacillus (in: firmicutes) TaxID=185979 RepID=UPI000BF28B0C|nr:MULTISPECIES: GNAT family N-acetyltransferase [unclassified Bacillus (in: firmicutes)]PFN76438.1 GNAT family N-acetyltransferase [Bacillus sp. AFS076308]PGV54833.1 GNAT family N-acetyltransferase [Bacillus sp. AFS037270]
MSDLNYKVNAKIKAEELSSVFKLSGLKRPYEDLPRLEKMIENADILISAWDEDKLVGIARAITDFSYCCYLSDLAVDQEYQNRGIGRELVRLVQERIGEEVTLLLLASPIAMEYYPHIGFDKVTNGYIIPRQK